MHIEIDPASTVAPYDQVRRQIAAQAADGTLPAGTKLPPVRALATTLDLAVNTVARAYRELEAAGLVETRGRLGTVITARATGTPARAQQAADTYVSAVRALGIPPDQALALVRAALDR